MKKKLFLPLFLCVMCLGIVGVTVFTAVAQDGNVEIAQSEIPLKLWYDEEAIKDNENSPHATNQGQNEDIGWAHWSLPIGNGYVGANVFGRTETERIQITEKTLMQPTSVQDSSGTYHTVGGLNSFSETYIDFGHTNSNVTDYSRYLDLKTAISGVEYTYNDVKYTREYFTSYPDKAIVIKLDADTEGALDFTLRPTIAWEQSYAAFEGDRASKTGTVTSSVSNGVGCIELQGKMGFYDIDFMGQYRVYTDGGEVIAKTVDNGLKDKDGTPVSANDGAIQVKDANSAYIVITLGTDYELSSDMFVYLTETDKPTYDTDMDDTRAKVEGDMNALIASRIQGKSFDDAYKALKNAHVKDHSSLFGRVSLDLDCKQSDMALTTDELLAQYKDGTNKSNYLDTLIFQYGRYLLVASSREGTLPATLQGAWNTYNTPAWACAYTHNINIQMNYWPAFNTNLAETFQSYVEYNQAYMERAQMYADKVIQQYYPELNNKDGGNGFVVGNHNYPYRVTTDRSAGNLGLTTQMFWDYYDFTQDSEVLEDIYPVLVEAARYITKCVEYNAEEDAYLVAYCDSPEVHVNGEWYYTSGTTYAQTFAYLNNYHALLAAKEMGINLDDTELLDTEEYSILKTIMEQIDKYDPIHVGLSGQIKEFREEDYYSSVGDDPHHRHISQLMALYPGDIINSNTPAWLDAAEVTLTKRGDTGMGWSRAHKMSLWARVKDGDRAYSLLDNLISNRTNENLWNAGPPFQIDGSFGATAGVAEMLLQSHEGYIAPLPAIPEGWADGSYTGLVARGDFEVSAAWENGVAKTFNITSNSGGTAKVYYPSITGASVETVDGEKVSYTVEGTNLISFETEVGETYIIYGLKKVDTPDAPTELICDSDSDSHEISWTASAGADSYNVYVAVEDEATYTLVGTTRDTSFSYVPENGDMTSRTTIAVTAVSEGESDRAITYTAESIKTEYGTIPSSEITEDVSFAIFAKKSSAKEYTFVDTYSNFVSDALYTAGDLLNDTYAGGEIVVYMFKDNTSSGAANGGAAWNRAFQINGSVVVDLGGNQLTSTAPRLVGFEAKTTGCDNPSSVTFKNGTISTAKIIAEVFGGSVYSGTRTCELTFNNIDFVPNGTVSDFVMVKTRGSYSATQKANFNLKLTDCTIDYDTYAKTTILDDTCTAGTVDCSVEVQGGTFTGTSLETFVFSKGLASEDSITFTKNASGDRMKLTLDYTDSCPEDVFKTENGEVKLASISVDNVNKGAITYTLSDVKTPYGYLPKEATNKVFSLVYNGLHINSYDTYKSAIDKAKAMLYAGNGEYKGGTVAIYMNKSYVYDMDPYANFAQIDGTYILDLGGNTLTQKGNYLFDVVGKAVDNTILKPTVVEVKNGTILTNDEPIMKVSSNGTSGNFGYNGTKTFEFTYKDITFDKSSYATGYKPLMSVGTYKEVDNKNLYLSATFDNCTFTSSDSLLFDLSVSNYIDANIKIKGGHLTTDDTSTNFILKGSDSNDKLIFAKGSNGKYMSLTVPTGVAVPTTDFNGLTFEMVSSDETTDTYRLKNPAETEEGGVIYESLKMASYWSTTKKTAPIKIGYVFGGWFTKSGNAYVALKAANITTDSDGKANVSGTYAKFVPAEVLSVKAQNSSGTAASDGKAASVRVISALDSTDYQKVGFKVLVNNKNDLGTLETTKIFNGLQVEGDSSSPYSAEEIFGSSAAYLSVWRLDNIADKNDAKILNVTPYWITMDGTKVEGLSKYVHVEDGYMGYISVPVNLCDVKDIAAGKVEIKYPAGLTLVKDKVEFDGVFKGTESAFYDDGNGTIRIVGNAETVNTAKTADGIFVNLRFKANSTSVYPGAGKGTFLTFGVTGEDFCDWSKNTISIDAWDVQY